MPHYVVFAKKPWQVRYSPKARVWLKEWLADQHGFCLYCLRGFGMKVNAPMLDHDKSTERCRAVIHWLCRRRIGWVENSQPSTDLQKDEASYRAYLTRVAALWPRDGSPGILVVPDVLEVPSGLIERGPKLRPKVVEQTLGEKGK